MCEYCGCQAIAAIATLTSEHDQALDHVRTAVLALRARDLAQVQRSCAELRALLAPHTAVEEQALFPAMEADFPDQIAALVAEHRTLDQALAEGAETGTRQSGWEGRLLCAFDDLHRHIRKEQDGVFPAALSTLTPAQWDRLQQVRPDSPERRPLHPTR